MSSARGCFAETVQQAILTDAPALPTDDAAAAAVAFRAIAPTLTMLTDAERALLAEWLDRADAASTTPAASADPG